MNSKSLLRFAGRVGSRTTFILALAAFLLAGFSFAESGSAAPLAWDYATVLTVGNRIGIGTESPDANTVIDARRSDTTDTYIKSRHLTKGAYFQTQSGINWAGYNMLNAAGATATYFGYRGSTAFRIYDALAAEDRLLMDAAGTDNGNIYLNPTNTGSVGIGTTTLDARLDVLTDSGRAIRGQATATTGDFTVGVVGSSDHPAGYGVIGRAQATAGENYGVFGRSESTDGYGVFGLANATTGSTYGVYGKNDSSQGTGVYGYASATTGDTKGIYGETLSTTGTGVAGIASASTGSGVGVLGFSESTTGYGVVGCANATMGTAMGVYGFTYASSGYGVMGHAYWTTGYGSGVYGVSDSTSGRGVVGEATETSGTNSGVYGRSSSPSGFGLLGVADAESGGNGVHGDAYSTSGIGVFGYASASTGTTYGVYGRADSTSGYGVYSYGDLSAYGDFTVIGSKSAIVETQDYGWRSLYAVESPRNWFEDFGQDTLSGGEAVVTIDPIFAQTVNLDENYLVFLTPSGGGCTLFVADRSSTSFTIRANEGSSCEIGFDYRIIAPRLDYEDLRLEPAVDPETVAAAVLAAMPETE